MIILAYSGIELNSLQGLKHLMKFASNNHISDFMEAVEMLILCEEDMAAQSLADYYETLRDAMPTP